MDAVPIRYRCGSSRGGGLSYEGVGASACNSFYRLPQHAQSIARNWPVSHDPAKGRIGGAGQAFLTEGLATRVAQQHTADRNHHAEKLDAESARATLPQTPAC